MQCPNCSRELVDQTRCQDCDWKDETSQEKTPTLETGDRQESAGDLNTPFAYDLPPQVAGSSKQPTQTESSERNKAQFQEPVPPLSNVETAVSGNTINSNGDLSIIGQANKSIENIFQTELHDSEIHAERTLHSTEVRNSKIHSGGDVTIAGTSITIQNGIPSGKTEEERSIYSFTQQLPPRTIELHESVQAVNDKVSQLKATRLMFITCPYPQFAVDAGHVAIKGLGLDGPDQNRILSYEDVADKHVVFTAQKLLEQIPEKEEDDDERSILIYAQNTLAQSFLDSFFDTPNRLDIIRAELGRSDLFMVVIVAPQFAQRRLNSLKRTPPFAYVEIPFLWPFLQLNYPDKHEQLNAEIICQRAPGEMGK